MKTIRNLAGIVLVFFMLCFLISCEDNNETGISGKLIEVTEDVLSGDSAYLTVEIDGGSPPFAFKYYTFDDNNRKQYSYILGINERRYTFAHGYIPYDTVTYYAESVASYYQNVGPATGSATFNVVPVDYVVEETIFATKTGYIQKSVNALNVTASQLLLKTEAGNYARTVYFEFDANDIQNIQEKSRYMLKFWIVSTHSTGVNKSALMEVSGKPGALNEDMTWDTQPAESDFTLLFSKDFMTTSTDQQIQFSGDISPIVYQVLESTESTDSKKFTIRIREGKGTNGIWYIGGNPYGDEDKRPSFDVQFRKAKTQ